MPSPANPNPLGCLSFVIYPLSIAVVCFGIIGIVNTFNWLMTGQID